jgi:hypothetical protein
MCVQDARILLLTLVGSSLIFVPKCGYYSKHAVSQEKCLIIWNQVVGGYALLSDLFVRANYLDLGVEGLRIFTGPHPHVRCLWVQRVLSVDSVMKCLVELL